MTPAAFRKAALSLTGAVEGSHMGHADFRANGRIFATLGYPEASHAMVKLSPDEQEIVVAGAPDTFMPVPGGWGKGGATRVLLKTADDAAVKSALSLAHAAIMAKKAARPRKST
jgi:hypothetical protein